MEEKRQSPRLRRNLACSLRCSFGKGRGSVREVSAGGLSVQADLEVSEGETLRVSIEVPVGPPVEVDAIVWHAHRVRSRRTGKAGFLLGLVVSSPPEAWFGRVGAPRVRDCVAKAPASEAGGDDSPPARAPDCCEGGAQSSYVVRVKQTASPRTRTYRLEAPSLAKAQARAESDAGDDWRVIEVRVA